MKSFLSLLIVFVAINTELFAAEAGMPQLDPAYWASQAFWLIIIFSSIYFLISRIFVPKIKNNIDSREDKIRKDLEEANILKEQSDKKLKEYNRLIDEAKNDAKKILLESRQKLNDDIQIKRKQVEQEIEKETKNAEKEIENFKLNSSKKITSVSEELASNLIKDIFGEELNQSSIKAAVAESIKESKI